MCPQSDTIQFMEMAVESALFVCLQTLFGIICQAPIKHTLVSYKECAHAPTKQKT